VAAMLISISLGPSLQWRSARIALLWTANLTWISLAALIVSLIVMMNGYTQAGNQMTPDVIAVVGYVNRLLVLVYCAWVLVVARHALVRHRPSHAHDPRAAAVHAAPGRA
jgi:hypothetical protein